MPIPTARVALFSFLTLVLLSAQTSLVTFAQSSGEDYYLQKIKPLFTEKCIACHGAIRAEAGLRLDAIQLIRKGSDSGAITRSSAEVSNSSGDGGVDTRAACVLVDRVTTGDVAERMPPEGEGTALDAEQLAVLKAWIELGLPGPEQEAYLTGPSEHWAYQPIARPAVPALSFANETATARAATPIDHFVFASQAQRNLQANDQATAADWMRRVAFDLTGLAPSPEMLVEVTSNDSRTTRARFVDLLLGSPEYGERWGRHWMDVWRYSDWDGYKDELRGSQRHIWHWRDWIVESLNEDKPYDEMIVEMLAADEVSPNDPKALRATGFLARNYHISNRDIWLDAAVEHTTKAFLGMTVQCARCHDHKFDPISQEHFYQFRAIFEPHRTRTDQVAGEPDVKRAGVPRVFDAELSAETFLYERGNEKQPRKDKPIQPGVVSWIPAAFEVFPVDLPRDSFVPELSEPTRSNAISAKTRAHQRAADELAKLQGAAVKSTEEKAAKENAPKDVEADLRLATLRVEFAAADLAALLARYAADDLKYSGQAGSGARVSGTANRDVNASELAELAREAAVREHAAQRLQAMLSVAESQAALRKANSSNVKDEAKRKAAVAAAEKAVVEAEKKLAAFTELAADSVTYTSVGKELPRQSTGRRTALARWIVSPNNPLTARVAVNHIWMRHFGTPLVDNVFDFGMKAPRPELLDMLNWLSAELIESGWSMKHLHRLIVLSEVYALSSDDVDSSRLAKNNAIDPDNRYYWRSNVRRMDAEEVRDNLLVAGGCLDKSFAGPDIDFEVGEDVYRRSIYFRHAYEKQMSMLVLFDAASPGDCYRRRPSVIPQQALALANSGLTRSMARTLVRELEAGGVEDDSGFIATLFARTLNRQPTVEELKKCEEFLVQQKALLAEPAKLTAVVSASKSTVSAATDPRSRARESLALVLLNHNDFVTVR